MTENIVQEKIDFIAKTLKVLKDILQKRQENILLKDYLFFAAQKKAEEIVESAISLNQELLKTYFKHLSGSYYESFVDLKRMEIFEEEELIKLASTAGFRNRLAHDYLKLDNKITEKSLEKILEIYPNYLKKIKKFIDQK